MARRPDNLYGHESAKQIKAKQSKAKHSNTKLCKLKIPDKRVRRAYNLVDRYLLYNVWRV